MCGIKKFRERLKKFRERRTAEAEARRTEAAAAAHQLATRRATAYPQEDSFRSMITAENQVVSQRMGWLAAFNSLLFVALGSVVGSYSQGRMLNVAELSSEELCVRLVGVLCVVGILVSLFARSGLVKAALAVDRLTTNFDEMLNSDRPAAEYDRYHYPGVIGWDSGRHKASIFRKLWIAWSWRSPWNYIPWCFICAWGFIFYLVVPVNWDWKSWIEHLPNLCT